MAKKKKKRGKVFEQMDRFESILFHGMKVASNFVGRKIARSD